MMPYLCQLVRPDGTVITQRACADELGPSYDYGHPVYGEIRGEVYGRYRASAEGPWLVTHWWPNGPHRLPAYVDMTGEGAFLTMEPGVTAEREDAARRLREAD